MQVEISLLIFGLLVSQTRQGRSEKVQKCRCREPVRSAAQQTGAHSGADPPSQTPPSLVIHVRLSGGDTGGSLLPGTPSSKMHPSIIQSRRRRARRLAAGWRRGWLLSPPLTHRHEVIALTVRVCTRSGPCHKRQLRGDRHRYGFDGPHIRMILIITVDKMNLLKYNQDTLLWFSQSIIEAFYRELRGL